MSNKQQDLMLIANERAEMAALGTVLMHPQSFYIINTILEPKDFGLLKHAWIFQAFQECVARDEPIEYMTVSDALERHKRLKDVGGESYLIKLSGEVPNSTHGEVYARLVKAASTRRKLLMFSDIAREFARDEEVAIEDVLSELQSTFLDISSGTTRHAGYWASEVADELIEQARKLIKQGESKPEDLPFIRTGLTALDEIIIGFEPDDLMIIAGRPGMGKSALVTGMILHVAQTLKRPVIYHTMEMSRHAVMRRMVAMMTGVTTERQKRPQQMMPDEHRKVSHALTTIKQLPIYFEDSPSPSPKEVFGKSEWIVRQGGAAIVFVDGIYRMRSDRRHNGNHEKFTDIVRDLRTYQSKMRIPMICTHQLSRGVEQRTDKRPMLSDLRESGTLEEEANKVLMLYRDEVYNEATDYPNQADLLVVKNRDGRPGTASVYFDKSRVLFQNGTVHRLTLEDLE